MEQKEYYRERADQFDRETSVLDSAYRKFSYIRLALTITALALFVYFANAGQGYPLFFTTAVYVVLFGLLVKRHNRIRDVRDIARQLRTINLREIERLEHRFDSGDAGERYLEKDHGYAHDLDLFGPSSVYQMLNRCSTMPGSDRLASWLLQGADPDEIASRQGAVKELREHTPWCQEFEARGSLGEEDPTDVRFLQKWLNEEDTSILPSWLAIISVLIFLAILTLVIIGTIAWNFLIIPILLNGFLLRRYYAKMKYLMEVTFEGNKALRNKAGMIQMLETTEFNSPKLSSVQSVFRSDRRPASLVIKKLNRHLDLLQSRANFFYVLLDLVFLLDHFLYLRLLAWKRAYASQAGAWFDQIAETEALISLAGHAFAYSNDPFPEFSDSEVCFIARGLGHPLIASEKRVSNDVSVKGGSVVLITGSNMSGKSTFLRTVGVNLVLAQAGSVVCAEELILSPFRLFTSMRTTDRLEESVSSFYAELQRIRMLLDILKENGPPVMYMLDELLKGTNSTDRHKGSVALIQQLEEESGIGWVSTHDLALGDLALKLDHVEAMSFNSREEGNELIFDYKLERGICHSFNASLLMRRMGIQIDGDDVPSDR